MAIRDAMLALLTAGPRHGYQLKAEFEDAVIAHGTLNAGQVYTTLDRLARDGLVNETDLDVPGADERRRPFALTSAGHEVALAWFLAPPPPADRSRDELVSRVLLALHTDAIDPLAVIDAQRASIVDQLRVLRQHQRAVDDDLVAALTADAVASSLEADLGWLDRTEARLRRTHSPTSAAPRRGRSPSGGRRA